MDKSNSFYEKHYKSIINNILTNIDNNQNLLLFINNQFNILDNFSYILKKKNISIDIIIENYCLYEINIEYIKGSEFEDRIKIYNKIDELLNMNGTFTNNNNNNNNYDNNNIILKKYFKIIVFHIKSLDFFTELLDSFLSVIDNKTSIYFYITLSNQSMNKIKYKNLIRENIMKYTNTNMGTILPYNDFTNLLSNSKEYKLKSLKIYKSNNYFLYGTNTVYEIIINKVDL